MYRAQESFDRINIEANHTQKLYKANIHPRCNHGVEINDEVEVKIEKDTGGSTAITEEDNEKNITDLTVSIEVKLTTDYDEKSVMKDERYEYSLFIDESTHPTTKQSIKEAHAVFRKAPEVALIGGVCLRAYGKPVYLHAGIQIRKLPIEKSEYPKLVRQAKFPFERDDIIFLNMGVCLDSQGRPYYLNGGPQTPYHFTADDYKKTIKEAQQSFESNEKVFLFQGISIDRFGVPVYQNSGMQDRTIVDEDEYNRCMNRNNKAIQKEEKTYLLGGVVLDK